MTDKEKQGLLKNICVSDDKLEDYLNTITLESTKTKDTVNISSTAVDFVRCRNLM